MINTIKDIIFSLLNRQTINLLSDESLKNEVVIVSGASKGVGKIIADVLHKQGAKLVLFSRNLKELKSSFSGLDKDRAILIKADVSSQEDTQKVVKTALNKFGKIDVLINNAGLFKEDYLENISEDQWENIVSTNIKGIFLMTKAAIPTMKKQKDGLVINIGSRISHNPQVEAKMTLYATTKYAVEGLSKSLNNELKPWGIRVSCIMPGTVNTFRSPSPQKYLSPHAIGQIIALIIKQKNVDFESIIIKSKYD